MEAVTMMLSFPKCLGLGMWILEKGPKKDARGGRTYTSKDMGGNKVQDVLEKQQVVKFSREWKLRRCGTKR